jgi:hypothetical protein
MRMVAASRSDRERARLIGSRRWRLLLSSGGVSGRYRHARDCPLRSPHSRFLTAITVVTPLHLGIGIAYSLPRLALPSRAKGSPCEKEKGGLYEEES